MSQAQETFQFDEIRRQLQEPGDGFFRDIEWLERSRQNPQDFERELLRYHAARVMVPIKSTPQAGFDFYHDLILRHQAVLRPALLFCDSDGSMRSLTYAELHHACSRRCAAWAAQGVQPGETLCVIEAMGKELLLSVLCGLRMGLRVCLLPPLGPDFLAHRLRRLPKGRIATAERYLLLLSDGEMRQRVLAAESSMTVASAAATSHTYGPEELALSLFSPMRDPSAAPLEILAARAYLDALRDGLLFLGLGPGKVLAAPECHLLQYQPALLLATLLQGATFLHLGSHDFAPDKQGLMQTPLHVLFCPAVMRDAMLKLPPRPLANLELWVTSPEEQAAQAWHDWAERYTPQTTHAATMLFDAASGGCVLFSLRRCGEPPKLLQPVPGRPFVLRDPTGSSEPAPPESGHGILSPLPDANGVLLSRLDQAFVYGGSARPTRGVRSYPTAEIEQVVSSLPFVLGVSIVAQRGDAGAFALLVFTGPEPLDVARELSAPRTKAVCDQIRVRLGPEFLPTNVELFAMFPRYRGRLLDHGWCARQYQSGALRQREGQPLFRLLDRLRMACTRSYSAAPSAKAVGAGREAP